MQLVMNRLPFLLLLMAFSAPVGSQEATVPSTVPPIAPLAEKPAETPAEKSSAEKPPLVIVPAEDAKRAEVSKVTIPRASETAGQVLSGPVTAPVEPQLDKALSLEESILIALSNHGDISAAQEGFAGSIERITSTRAGGAPQLGIESGYSNRSVRAAGGTGFGGGTNTDTSLVLSQNLFDSGLRSAQTRVARAQSGAALAGVAQARSQVAFGVANAYFDQLRQERLLELANEQVKVAQENLRIVQGRIEAEEAARVDEIPIQVEVRQREFNRTTAENNVRTAQVNFRNALGLGRGPALKIQNVSVQVPTLGAVDEYFAAAQRLNPDLKISQANLQSAQASLEVARIQGRPRVSVDVSLAAGIFDSPRRQSGLTAGLNLPIFDGGARRANRRAAQDSLDATRLRDEQLAKDVAADLESAYATARSANERIAAARSLEEVAITNLNVAQERYRQELGTPYEITTAQLQLFNAQISSVQALYDYYLAHSALERATGARSGLPDAIVTPIVTPVVAPAPVTPAAPVNP
jgi:outer membrane protein TolC